MTMSRFVEHLTVGDASEKVRLTSSETGASGDNNDLVSQIGEESNATSQAE